MSTGASNNAEAERLYIQALELDPSNETVLTMFAIFQCNRYIFIIFVIFFSIGFLNRNQFEEAANLYERAIQCSRGEEKLMQYAALFYAIRAERTNFC
jgi:tetratricopeptide (TPR) repeat protein